MNRILVEIFICGAICLIGNSAFNFPSDTGAPPAPAPVPIPFNGDSMVDLTRQVITPAIVTPSNSCICVPTGQCNFGTVVGNTDGSGLIDIRIVNSVSRTVIKGRE